MHAISNFFLVCATVVYDYALKAPVIIFLTQLLIASYTFDLGDNNIMQIVTYTCSKIELKAQVHA